MDYLKNDMRAGLTPEMNLLSAVMHQAVKDARSAYPDIRHEAHAFFGNASHVAYWETLLGFQDGVLLDRISNILQNTRAGARHEDTCA